MKLVNEFIAVSACAECPFRDVRRCIWQDIEIEDIGKKPDFCGILAVDIIYKGRQ